MLRENKRLLKVFLCHASGDKPPVRDLYKRLTAEGVDAWLDKEKLLPGQDWRLEIPKAVQEADVVVVCLSNKSITKEGYVQKEIKFALDIAEEKPEGAIFLIPARLEDCPVPERLSRWQWVDLYEENGFIQLLRSLKLRALAVGATVEPSSYVDSDKETERRLEQFYTEGLAAFYTEDWDKACQRFHMILRESPNHKAASEKLAEAERQRSLAKLYAQSLEACQAEDWQAAIRTLDELTKKCADYKDAASLLRDARKKDHLRELYAEAGRLHAAQQWQAVVKVFEQISVVDLNFLDAKELLSSAQKEVAEIKRIEALNHQYSHALREMEAGKWHEARQLLEAVHKSQTGFLETERLLRKVENEITKEEEERKQSDQINTLYEQAHGLFRSKKWRNALEKLEQIRKLDEQFTDTDGIAEKAQKELVREEQEAERQNKLAAMYAEAVKLLKDEKYQEALEKWQDVKALDPKYPDRQWVGRTARRKLAETARPVHVKPRIVISKPLWAEFVGLIVVGVVITGLVLSGGKEQSTLPTSVPTSTQTIFSNPDAIRIPQETNTPHPATSVPGSSGYSDPTMYDDFNNSIYDGSYNKLRWNFYSNSKSYEINQRNGTLSLSVTDQSEISLGRGYPKFIKPTFFEVRLYLDPQTTNSDTGLAIELGNANGFSICGINRTGNNAQQIVCFSEYYGERVEAELNISGIQPGWHILRFEIEPEMMIISSVVDGRQVAQFIPNEVVPDHFNEFKQSSFTFSVTLNNHGPSKTPVGYVDYVRKGAIEDDPNMLFYDNFNDSKYNNRYNQSNWTPPNVNFQGRIYQQDGQLVLTQGGYEEGQLLTVRKTSFSSSKNTIIQADLMVDKKDSDAEIALHINTTKRLVVYGLKGWYKFCWYELNSQLGKPIDIMKDSPSQLGDWHVFTVEFDPLNHIATFYINSTYAATLQLDTDEKLSGITLGIYNMSPVGKYSKGYADNVKIMTMDQP